MTEDQPKDASAKDTYTHAVEDATRKWKSTTEALDRKYLLQQESYTGDQSPAALYSQYLRQRDVDRIAWLRDLSAAGQEYTATTGEKKLPTPGWSPAPTSPLPGPGQPTPPSPQESKAKTHESESPESSSHWPAWAGAGLIALVGWFMVSSIVDSNNQTRAAGEAIAYAQSSTVEVLYEVEGSATSANLTMASATGTVQFNGKLVPLQNKTTGKRGLTTTMSRGDFVYISAQNKGSSGTITCRITADGVVVSTNTSSGGYAIASCNGRA